MRYGGSIFLGELGLTVYAGNVVLGIKLHSRDDRISDKGRNLLGSMLEAC